jgi:hypothetical protein
MRDAIVGIVALGFILVLSIAPTGNYDSGYGQHITAIIAVTVLTIWFTRDGGRG